MLDTWKDVAKHIDYLSCVAIDVIDRDIRRRVNLASESCIHLSVEYRILYYAIILRIYHTLFLYASIFPEHTEWKKIISNHSTELLLHVLRISSDSIIYNIKIPSTGHRLIAWTILIEFDRQSPVTHGVIWKFTEASLDPNQQWIPRKREFRKNCSKGWTSSYRILPGFPG